MAMRAYRAPSWTPKIRFWKNACIGQEPGRSGSNRFLVFVSLALDLQHDRRFLGVPVLVEGDVSRHPRIVLRLRDCLAERVALGPLGAFDRVREDLGRIIAE